MQWLFPSIPILGGDFLLKSCNIMCVCVCVFVCVCVCVCVIALKSALSPSFMCFFIAEREQCKIIRQNASIHTTASTKQYWTNFHSTKLLYPTKNCATFVRQLFG